MDNKSKAGILGCFRELVVNSPAHRLSKGIFAICGVICFCFLSRLTNISRSQAGCRIFVAKSKCEKLSWRLWIGNMTKGSWKSSNYSSSWRCVTLLSLWFSFTIFFVSLMHLHWVEYAVSWIAVERGNRQDCQHCRGF